MTFGELIASRMDALGLTMFQVAEHVGIAVSRMSKWRHNIGYPGPDQAHRLAEILQVDLEELKATFPQVERPDSRVSEGD